MKNLGSWSVRRYHTHPQASERARSRRVDYLLGRPSSRGILPLCYPTSRNKTIRGRVRRVRRVRTDVQVLVFKHKL